MMSGLLSAGAVVAATNKFRSEVYMRGHSEQYRRCQPRTAPSDSFLYSTEAKINQNVLYLYLLQFQAFAFNYIKLKI